MIMHRYVLQPIERHAQLLEEKLAIPPALKTVARYDEAEDAVMDDLLLSSSRRAELLRQLRLKKLRANLAYEEAGPRAIHVKPHKSVRFNLPPGLERKRGAVVGDDRGPPGKRVKKTPRRAVFKKPKVKYRPKLLPPSPSSSSSWVNTDSDGSSSSSRRSSVSSHHSGKSGSHRGSMSSLSNVHSDGSGAALLTSPPQMVTRSQKAKDALQSAKYWISSVSDITLFEILCYSLRTSMAYRKRSSRSRGGRRRKRTSTGRGKRRGNLVR